ncbi:non-ribosomal peptide synthetase/type I polyketide synthase [Chitinophaga sp. LS1]|uniref:non-ribosomal peptide synthetase/type I polyketide synthase n=1 Tax=Chitinophaga sp. LS1 TaxID=3051176 RepID=UPI002AABAEF5|nr:non-ribosomal peptide synthetase/type I polyketide synthase [Chitinophaga sp. LS1]WPV66533.1 amino acid adenylation domain-containing protein [Chitinophaga sp. LS1]
MNAYTGFEIAVVGMAGKFPGASDMDAFWEVIANNKETIQFSEEKRAANKHKEGYVPVAGIIDGYENFDNEFFGFSEREANLLEPQVRLFYQTVWHALEDAGCVPEKADGKIGLYAGITDNVSWKIGNHLALDGAIAHFEANTLTKTFFNTLISYKLNLTGPSVFLQTACSTSLVAVHNACQGLINGECDIALAGGATVMSSAEDGYVHKEGMIYSKDGRVRAFDKKASGTVFSQGIGVVTLKRLEDAVNDGDHIYAIIKGSAINNDGYRKTGYTAPSIAGQAEVIAAALRMAEVNPETVGYVECHGTGTYLGDPIEIAALKEAFDTEKRNFCAVGSVKANIGHTDSASGIAGLMKAVLALKHKKLPPAINFEESNEDIDFKNSPFYVNTELKGWDQADTPRRAGVSSFGIGGTNAHVVLEEYNEERQLLTDAELYAPVILSGLTGDVVSKAEENFKKYLDTQTTVSLADIAFSNNEYRKEFPFRKLLIGHQVNGKITVLDVPGASLNEGTLLSRLVFMFPGQGSQYVNMGKALYEQDKWFRADMDECFTILNKLGDTNFRELLYPADDIDSNADRINQTMYAQPLLFSVSYALGKNLIRLGVKPYGMIGHSLGEYVAACLSGVISVKDALKIVYERGRLMQQVEAGTMVSVALSWDEMQPLLTPGVDMAAYNGEQNCVVSGTQPAIEAFTAKLTDLDIVFRELKTSHAFHSYMMESIMGQFKAVLSTIRFHEPAIPFISNVTGKWITKAEAMSVDYWVDHIRKPVNFYQGCKTLQTSSALLYLEVGPGNTLTGLIRPGLAARNEAAVHFIKHPKDKFPDAAMFARGIGQLALFGQSVNWKEYFEENKVGKVRMPLYPFNQKAFRNGFPNIVQDLTLAKNNSAGRKEIADWSYYPSWKKLTPVFNKTAPAGENILILHDHTGLSAALAAQLSGNNQISNVFTSPDKAAYTELLKSLQQKEQLPHKIIHCLNIYKDRQEMHAAINNSFFSLVYLSQAIGELLPAHPLEIIVISSEIFNISNESNIIPEKAMLMGPARIIGKEYANINVRLIDIDHSYSGTTAALNKTISLLVNEISDSNAKQIIAHRGNGRWEQDYGEVELMDQSTGLATGKTYLITGGLGSIGFNIASYLLKNYDARLLLIGRSVINTGQQATDGKTGMMAYLQSISDKVTYCAVNIEDEAALSHAVTTYEAEFGNIDGVLHAAGIAGGGLIQLKTATDAQNIFGPKVQGTLNLDKVLAARKLDFFTIFSSISSIVPVMGGVDYNAANSFIDAFVQSKDGQGNYQSINWDAWKEGGMAVGNDNSHLQLLDKPILGHIDVYKDLLVAGDYYFSLDYDKEWWINEHIFDGKGIMVGVAYWELIWSLLEISLDVPGFEIEDLIFLTPVSATEHESREVKVSLRSTQTGSYSITISCKDTTDEWRISAKAHVNIHHEDPIVNTHTIAGNVIETHYQNSNYSPSGNVYFGPRWINTDVLHVADKTGYCQLTLNDSFLTDLDSYRIHAALVDRGTGFLARYLSDKSYLPFSYRSVRVYGKIPARIHCYSRMVEIQEGSIVMDVSFVNDANEVLVDIKGYTMLEYNDSMKMQAADKSSTSPRGIDFKKELQQNLDEKGILFEEGIFLLEKIIGTNLPQIVVSTTDLHQRLAHGIAESLSMKVNAGGELVTQTVNADNMADLIANVWETVLDCKVVDYATNYFDLGGDSLKAIIILEKIKRELGVDISLPSFFKYPTVLELSQFLNSQQKSDVIALPVYDKKEFYNTTYSEKNFFFTQLFLPESSASNLTRALEIKGKPNVEKIVRIMDVLIERHEMLRSVFVEKGGEVYRVIHDSVPFHVNKIEAKEEYLNDLILSLVQPFNVSEGPLIRTHLINVGEEKYYLMLDVHHIIFDAISQGIMMKEFMELFRGNELAPIEYYYRDYAEFVNSPKWLEKMAIDKEFWLNEIGDHEEAINLPYDFPRPALYEFRGATFTIPLPESQTRQLKVISRENDCTLFVTLMTTFNIFLQKITGQDDLIVGVPVSIRKFAELQPIVGNLVNFLPVRNHLSADQTFAEALTIVKENSMNVFERPDYPIGLLKRHLKKQNVGNRDTIFDVMFSFHNEYMGDIFKETIDGLTFTEHHIKTETALFDIILKVLEIDNELQFSFQYNSLLFLEDTMLQFGKYFMNLIADILNNSKQKVSKLSLLDSLKYQELTQTFNGEVVPVKNESLFERFEKTALQFPDNTALVIGADSMSYITLYDRSSRLAAYLAQVAGNDQVIGVLMNRSFDMIVAIMAILKLNKAYLPIDPEFPEQRMLDMIADSKISTLLTNDNIRELPFAGQVVNVSSIDFSKYDPGTINTAPVSPDSPAYLIYTSGSTGKPKGILISQSNVINFIDGINDVIDFHNDMHTLCMTTISFDIFVLEVFNPLLSGGCVFIANNMDQLDAKRIMDIIADNKIELIQLTPSRLRMLLEYKNYPFPTCLKNILIGGEQLPVPLLQELKSRYTGRICNMYGPTENTVWSSVKDLTGSDLITIGQPIRNTRYYVVDKNLQLVPQEVEGELLIGGEGLGLGYWNNEELTKERMIVDPFMNNGSKVYRTGDIVKRLANGEIEFISRNDFQIKVRGYRVEVNDIETAILQYPGVKEGVILLQKNKEVNILVAYIKSEMEIRSVEILNFLRQRLPLYMIPDEYYMVDEMPMTANNKVDRNALAKVGKKLAQNEIDVKPSNEVEVKLLAIWEKLLNEDITISIEDNFFEIGGNSFLLGKLKMMILEDFAVEISIPLFFQYSSIKTMAVYISKLQSGNEDNQDENNHPDTRRKEKLKASAMKLRKNIN